MMLDTSDPALWQNTVVMQAGVRPGSDLGDAVQRRAKVMALTQSAEVAVITPKDPGGWSHDLRAALACRIARINRKEDLAAYYRAKITDPAADACSDPDYTGDTPHDIAVLSFTDRVAARPKDAGTKDIDALKAAGVSDADIVRLAELNAFLAYQLRLIDGLSLLQGAAR